MSIRGLSLSNGLTLADIDRRNNLVKRYDTAFGSFANEDKVLSGMDKFSQKAYEMMRSGRTREAFDLTREPPAISGFFGDGNFLTKLPAGHSPRGGRRALGFDSVRVDGTRIGIIFNRLKDTNLPNLDDGLAGLFRALDSKGLLDSTAVFVTGEFGRTPKINQRGGRDHYPRAMFCLLAGGGMQGGQVVGASDAKGEGPRDRVISPDDVAATFYHALGR